MIRPVVERYMEVLRRSGIRPERVYLYGSYVKGLADGESDIDVAIVSKDLSGPRLDEQLRLMEMRWGVDLRIEPHPFRPEEFTPDNPEAAVILEEGVEVVCG